MLPVLGELAKRVAAPDSDMNALLPVLLSDLDALGQRLLTEDFERHLRPLCWSSMVLVYRLFQSRASRPHEL
jgi:hypothetical protein